MRLLPAIRYEGHTISLQDPVVMDGELVTHCECLESNWRNQTNIINFTLYTDVTRVVISADTFNHKCREIFRGWRYFEDERGEHYFSDTFCSGNIDYANWFIDRLNNPQCITDGHLDRNKYIERLLRQGRAIYNYQRNDYILYTEQYFGTIHVTAEDIATGRVAAYNGLSVQARNHCDYSGFQTEARLNIDPFEPFHTITVPQSERKYIHSYNYRPDYIPHYIENEDPDATLLLGAEIEVAGNNLETDKKNQRRYRKEMYSDYE